MPASSAASRIDPEVSSSHWKPNVIVPRQIFDTSRPVRPRRACSMPATLTRLVADRWGYGRAMTQSDPTATAEPTNIQVYEANPEDAEGAALDRQSGRRLP